MNRTEFNKWAKEEIHLLDGSTGAALAALKGMDGSDIPEKYIIENPDSLVSLQKEYIQCGAEILLTATLGATSVMLKAHGLEDTEKINTHICKLSKQAAKDGAKVAVELGPTGQFMAPMGTLSFDEIVDIYKEQVSYCLAQEPDMFILETFIDLSEARAAVIAIRDLCDLPIIASMTFENSTTLSGNSPECVAITLEAAGADALGANCSTGPKEIADVIKKMATVTNLPLFAKPNAGKPQIIDGKTIFPMDAPTFADECKKIVEAGATLIGGCCGAFPEHIKALFEVIKPMTPIERVIINDTYISSSRQILKLNDDKFIPIGEKINPSGKKAFAKELSSGNMMPVVDFATEQSEAGAKVLDVNISAVGVDEVAMMASIAQDLPVYCPTPLCFDSSNTVAMEAALRAYCGKAIINSASADSDRMEEMIRLAKKYGAVIILLPFIGKSDLTSEDRIIGLEKLMNCCKKHGVAKNQVLVDGVVMSVSTNTNAAGDSLKFIKWCTDNNYLTTGGVSNVSFGLPAKNLINQAFLMQMLKAGLSTGIVNINKDTINAINSAYLLSGKDEWCMNWIEENG